MSKKILSASFILSLGTLGSYLLGFVREPIFAHAYGSSSLTDAYFSAFQVSDILFLLCISSALLGLVQPLFLQAKQEKGEQKGYQVFGNFFGVLQGIFLVLIAITYFFISEIFEFLYPQTFLRNSTELIQMGKIFLISNFIFGVSNFIGTFAMAHKRFISTAISPLLYNVGIILGILFFSSSLGIYAAAYGALFGAFLHLFSRGIEYFFHREKFFPCIDFLDPYLKELLFSLVLRWPIVSTIPLLLLYFNHIAGYQEGLYTLFRYTHNLQSAPIAIFGIAFATASFPIFSELFAQKKIYELQKEFFSWMKKILFWTIPASIAMFFLGTSILSILYNQPVEKFQFILPFLALSIPLESLSHLFARYFNSQSQASVPLKGNIFLFIGAMGFLFIFSGKISLEILLAGSYLFGFFLQSLFYFTVITSSFPSFQNSKEITLPALGFIFAGIFVYFLNISSILTLCIGSVLFAIIFFGILKILWKNKFFLHLKKML